MCGREPVLGNGGEEIVEPNEYAIDPDAEMVDAMNAESPSSETDAPDVETPTDDIEAAPAAIEGEPNGMQEVEQKILVGSRVTVNGKDAIVAEIANGQYKLLSLEDRQPMTNEDENGFM